MASEPMLLNLNKWEVDQVLWLPGANGNYASIPDVNIFDADTAHLQQSVGLWQKGAETSYAPEIVGDVDPNFGSNVMKVHAHGGDASAQVAYIPNYTFGSAGTYTIAADLWVPSGMDFTGVTLGMEGFAGSGTISQAGADISLTDQWQRVYHTVSIASGDLVGNFVWRAQGGPFTDNYFYVSSISLVSSSDINFVPSTRIVGDIDLRVRIAPKDLAPSTQMDLLGKWTDSTDKCYDFRLNTGGNLTLYWTEDTDTALSANSPVINNYSDEDILWLRATMDVDNGSSGRDIKFYTSNSNDVWDQLGSTVTQAGVTSIASANSIVHFGAIANNSVPFRGGYMYAEIRDGIDGPVVASVDFTDTRIAFGDSWFTDEGHELTINRSGDENSELISNNCWAFSGAGEYINLPHRTDFDFSGDVEVITRTFSHGSASLYFVTKDPSSSTAGMLLRQSGGNAVFNVPGAERSLAANFDTWSVISGRREAGIAYVRVDGTDSVGLASTDPINSAFAVRVGQGTNSAGGAAGWLGNWFAIFNAALTATKRAELEAWDGTVANEPTWLRTDAVFYINADDPVQTRQYEHDYKIINLAAAAPSTLYVRQSLTTSDTAATPSIDDFFVEVYPAVQDVEDNSVNDNHGTAESGAKLAQPPALFEGTSMYFDGKDDGVRWDDVRFISGTEFSFECWFDAVDTRSVNSIFSYATSNTNNNEILVYLNSSSSVTFVRVNNQSAFNGHALTENGWHHLVVTWRSSDGQTKAYVDGVQYGATATVTGGSVPSGGVLYVGQEQDTLGGGLDPLQAFHGYLDELTVYDRVLTAEEIAQHYQVGWEGKFSKALSDTGATAATETGFDLYSYPWEILGA